MMTENNDKLLAAVKDACLGIEDKFGEDIAVLKIGKISILADYFIIATGDGIARLRAMADEAEKRLFGHNIRLRHTEDFKGSKWILLDFGSIIIHLFCPEEREFYSLDAVWGDAEVVRL